VGMHLQQRPYRRALRLCCLVSLCLGTEAPPPLGASFTAESQRALGAARAALLVSAPSQRAAPQKLDERRVHLRLSRDARQGQCHARAHPETSPFEHASWASFQKHGKVFCAPPPDEFRPEHLRGQNLTRLTCFSDKADFERPTYCTAQHLFGVCRGGNSGKAWDPPLLVADGPGAAARRAAPCKWRAFCEPTAAFRQYRATRGGKYPRGDAWGEILKVEWPPPFEDELDAPFDGRKHYLVNGDCASSTFNPAHCIADVAVAYAMKKSVGLLGDREDTVIALANGFNNIKRGTPFYDFWDALAAEVIPQPEQARFRRVSAVFSPPSFLSPTWRSNHACVGRRLSPLIIDMQRDLAPRLDSAAQPRWAEWLGDEARLQNAIRVSPAHTWPLNVAPAGGFVLFALRCAPAGAKALRAMPQKERPRCMWNFNELWRATRDRFPNQALLAVHLTPAMDFMAQYALYRRARLVVGLHGGQLGHALWLRDDQDLIEIGHDGGTNNPSMFAGMATAAGGGFRWLGSPLPMTKKNGGDVVVQGVVNDMDEMLGFNTSRRAARPSQRADAPASAGDGPRVTISEGPAAGVDYSCAEKDARPAARELVGICVIKCRRTTRKPTVVRDSSDAARRCARAVSVCAAHEDCDVVDVNNQGTFATLKAAQAVDPPHKYGCPPAPDAGAC